MGKSMNCKELTTIVQKYAGTLNRLEDRVGVLEEALPQIREVIDGWVERTVGRRFTPRGQDQSAPQPPSSRTLKVLPTGGHYEAGGWVRDIEPEPPKCPKCGSLGEHDDLYKRHYCRNGLCPRCNTAVDAPGYGAPLQKLGVGGRARVVACQYDDDVVRLVRQEDEHSAQWLVEWADGERSWIDIDDLKPLSDRQVKP